MATSLYDTASYIATYCGELYTNRNEITDTVQDLEIDEQAAQYLADYPRSSTAGTTLLCRQIFDIASVGQNLSVEHRQQVGRVGGLMLVLTDIVDSQIDRPVMPLEAKERYLDMGMRLLLSGAESNFTAENKDQQVSFDLAHGLHKAVITIDEQGLFASLFCDLIPDVKQQLLSDDLEEHLKLAQKIGGTCALLGAVTVEHITGVEQPQARIAAVSIGAYAECLDHAYEMYEDIKDGVPTYITQYLAQHGDTTINRRRARENLLDVGLDSYREGLAVLDDRQKSIYKAICRMLDVRYRFIKRIGSIRDILHA